MNTSVSLFSVSLLQVLAHSSSKQIVVYKKIITNGGMLLRVLDVQYDWETRETFSVKVYIQNVFSRV